MPSDDATLFTRRNLLKVAGLGTVSTLTAPATGQEAAGARTKLELEDIQYILLARVPAITGRYEFLSFHEPAQGHAWLTRVLERVASVEQAQTAVEQDKSWVTVAFTYNGLRALGVSEDSLTTFPEEFRQGMVARNEVIGDIGANHPDNWVGGLASPNLHAVAVVFARDRAERERVVEAHQKLLQGLPGVEVLSWLDADAVPPIDSHRDHFGYRDRITYPVIEGTGVEPTPGSLGPIKAGEFILGYPDEEGPPAHLPQPQVLSRNGSFMAYRRMQEHVGAFREFLQLQGKTPEEQELVAAKLMGRWRSGAPLVLSPDRDDPALASDSQQNNNFNYGQMDPQGYAVPLGAHIRRMNPRDTAVNMQRRQIIRRGAAYGPVLPEGVPDDGADRGVVALLICASLVRQFEFIQNVWVNNANFHELGNEHDPIVGYQDGTFDFTMPRRPIRRKIAGLPSFTTVKGGAYFFLPGIKALRYLAALGNGR